MWIPAAWTFCGWYLPGVRSELLEGGAEAELGGLDAAQKAIVSDRDSHLPRRAGKGDCPASQYYDRGRLQQIRHEWAGDQSLILQLDYMYFADGLVHTITETGPDGPAAVTTFAYDNRNRLIEEERCGTGVSPVSYHLTYTYDQGGNRRLKRDLLANRDTFYYYDVDDAGATYETLNNRLMYYEVYENMTLLERRDYEYDNRGNPT
ncbi:MAG: hypothetical protein ABII12_14030, partial [Planctomycetota bacterium]